MAFWKPGEPHAPQKQSSSAQDIISRPTDSNAISADDGRGQQSVGLSKSVMGMKFMKRKLEADEQGKNEANKRKALLETTTEWVVTSARINNEQEDGRMELEASASMGTKSNTNKIVCTIETTDLLSSLPGRRSFNGFNKCVERAYAECMDAKRYERAVSKSERYGVSDEEMLARYESLIGLPGRGELIQNPIIIRTNHLINQKKVQV